MASALGARVEKVSKQDLLHNARGEDMLFCLMAEGLNPSHEHLVIKLVCLSDKIDK